MREGGRPFSIVVVHSCSLPNPTRAKHTHTHTHTHTQTLAPAVARHGLPPSLSLPPKRTSTGEWSDCQLRCSAKSLRRADRWTVRHAPDADSLLLPSPPLFSSLNLTRRQEPCHRSRPQARPTPLLVFTAAEECGGDGDWALCGCCSCLRVRREVFFSPCLMRRAGEGGHEAIVAKFLSQQR